MTNAVFIPKKINVGFCKREDTYTKRLAYVIYYDHKDKLRKETSWQNWRDHKIPNEEYENNPTEGFVLNKKVGGDRYDWNPRQTYARVHDPRGFEFEITVPNLLYILENTNSIKGKGLEGKFVYGWDAGELLLIPEAAPEYAKYVEFSDVIKQSVKAKDLALGGTYKTNKNEEVVYLGRFDYWDTTYNRDSAGNYINVNKGLHYFFKTNLKSKTWGLLTVRSLSGRIVQEVSSTPVPDYAETMELLERSVHYSPYDPSKDKYPKAKPSDFKDWTWVYFSLYNTPLKARVRLQEAGKFNLTDAIRIGGSHYLSRESLEVKLLYDMDCYYDYWKTCKGLPAQELIDKLGLTVKKEYLANGKEKK